VPTSLEDRLARIRRATGRTGVLFRAKDVLSQLGRGLADAGYSTALGATELVGADDAADAIRRARDEAHEFYGPAETTSGRIAGVAGRVAGEGAQFLAPGAILKEAMLASRGVKGLVSAEEAAKALQAARKSSTLARVLTPASKTGQIALNAVLEAPVNIAKAGARDESLAGSLADATHSPTLEAIAEDPLERGAFEIAGNTAAGLALEPVVKGVGRLAAPVVRSAGRALRHLTDFTEGVDDALASGASEGVAELRPDAFVGDVPRGPLQPHQRLLPKATHVTPPPAAPVDPLQEVRRETMIQRALRAARARQGDIDAAIEQQLVDEPMPAGVSAARRAAIEGEEPSAISRLIREAQDAIAEGQTRALQRIEGVGRLTRKPRPDAPSLRDAIRAFEDQRAAALAGSSAGIPSAASSDAEARLPRGGSASAKSALEAGTQALASQSHFSTSDLPSGVATPRTSPEPSRIQVGGNQKFTVGSLGGGIPNRKILQPTADINEIVRQTTEQLPIYRDDLSAATRDVPGAQVAGVRHKALDQAGRPNPAGFARLMQKVQQSEARGGGAHYIGDYLGGRVTVEDPAAADAVLERLERRGYRLVDDDDFTNDAASRGGYRARHVQLETPAGTTVELQFMSPEMSAAQNDPAGHAIYEAVRDTSHPLPPEEKARLLERMQAHFDAAHERAIARQRATLARQPRGTITGRPRVAGVDGDESEAFFQEREVPVRYRVVEADDLVPSNDAISFEKQPAYPEVIQGRSYHGEVGRAAREHVIAQTPKLNPKKLLNPTNASGGPPIVTPDGIVVAGNARTMMVQRAGELHPERAAEYRALLEERAGRFGIDPARVRAMRRPILVREITDPSVDVTDPDVLRQLNAASDMPRMKTKDPISDANTRAVQMKSAPAALEHLAASLEPDETLRQYLSRDGAPFFRELQASGVITPQEVAKYVDASTGKVTEEGKTLVERMLQLAAVPNVDLIKAAPDQALARLEHSIPAIVAVGTRPAWSLERPLTEALELLTAARRAGKGGLSVRAFLAQADAFGRRFSSEGATLARLLEENRRPTVIAEKFRAYADAAAVAERMGQSEDLFGATPEAPTAAFERIFGEPASNRSGHAGVTLLGAIAGGGAGAAAGYATGDTPEARARNAALGFAAGAGIPFLLRSAAGRALERGARGLAVEASPDMVLAHVRGAPTRDELAKLLASVRAHPGAKFRYIVRNEAGQAIGTGTSLADFFADVKHTMGARAGAIGTQPAAGSGAPLRRNRIAYRPVDGTAASPRVPAPTPNGAAAAGPAPTPDELDPEDYLNFSTVLLDPGGERRLRDEVARVVQREGLHPKRRVSWEETKRIAGQLGLHPEDLVAKGDVQRLTGAEMLAIRNIVKENVDALEGIAKSLATNPGVPDAERELLTRQMGALERQNDLLLAKFVRARSQTGRDLNNLKILAQGSLDPAVWMVKAKRVLGDRPLTEDIRQHIQALINRADRPGLATYVAKLRIPTRREKLLTLWKAGLLTAPTTHVANFLGNTTMAALETAKDVPAAALDALFSAVTGTRTKDLDLAATLAASRAGARKGLREASAIMQGKALGEGFDRYDLSREIDFNNAFLDRYTKTVFRSLTAADRIFRGAALERSLAEQARVLAKRAGYAGEAFEREVARLRAHPTDEMALRAIHDAEIATFQNRGALAQAAQGLRRPLGAVGEVVVPFTQTPANVATRVLEYSPLGALSTLPDIAKLFSRAMNGAEKAALQKKIVERLGRSAIGSMPILAGYLLAKSGRMTAGFPARQTERDQWALEGRQENSILINGKWRSVERISPLGNLMVFGAHLYDAFSDPTASTVQKVGSSVGALGKTLTEQSFLTGLQGAMEAVKDPERAAANYLRSTAGSVVPNLVTKVARASDPVQRERETIADELKVRLPGLSKTLPAKLNQFGEPIRHPSGTGSLIDFTDASRDRGLDDPIVAELERVGAEIPNAKRGRGETREQYRARVQRDGPIVKRIVAAIIASEQYQQMRPLAEVLTARDPRFRGRDPRELAKELQRGILEDAVRATRRQLTLAEKEE
jgi:hypothetical protein